MNAADAINIAPQELGERFDLLVADMRVPKRETKAVTVSARATGPSVRVLIAEDDLDAGDSLSLLLCLYGHEVLVARTGLSTLEMAFAFQPNVMLLDIGLPGMDGYQVAQRLRSEPEFKDVLLCALTGWTISEADRFRPQKAGFDHYFVKPVDLKKLLAVLNAAALRVSSQNAHIRK